MNKILLKIVVFTPQIDFSSLAASRSINNLTLKETLTLFSVKTYKWRRRGWRNPLAQMDASTIKNTVK